MSRGATLRQTSNAGAGSGAQTESIPSSAELAQWSEIFNLLVQRLAQPPMQLTTLFPSTRAKAKLPFGAPGLSAQRKAELEIEDRDIWQLMATMAISADMNQQQILVTGLRDKILENVMEAKQWSQANPAAASSGEGDIRIRNVNLLVRAKMESFVRCAHFILSASCTQLGCGTDHDLRDLRSISSKSSTVVFTKHENQWHYRISYRCHIFPISTGNHLKDCYKYLEKMLRRIFSERCRAV